MSTSSPLRLADADRGKPVPKRVIRELARIIAEKFNPDKIILFGSHAYGQPQPWSDVDLLVVMDVPREHEVRVAQSISKALPRRPFGVDILVRSQAVIDRRVAMDDWFLEEITTKGQVLYARDDDRVGRGR